MDSKFIVHSPGMISYNIENLETDEATVKLVEGTKLYQSLVSYVGKDKAECAVRGNNLYIAEESASDDDSSIDYGISNYET